MGDNAYDDGTHRDYDARFDPTIAPEATAYNASHIDYISFGDHDDGGGTEDNYSVPIPIAGVNAPAAPPDGQLPERNYSFDYGNVHFVVFDSKSMSDERQSGREGGLDCR